MSSDDRYASSAWRAEKWLPEWKPTATLSLHATAPARTLSARGFPAASVHRLHTSAELFEAVTPENGPGRPEHVALLLFDVMLETLFQDLELCAPPLVRGIHILQ